MAEERAAKRSRAQDDDKGKEEEEGGEEAREESGEKGAQEAEVVEAFDVLFRSYTPRDVKLQRLRRPQVQVPDMVAEINARVAALTAASRTEDILALAPKKAAWDLARDLQPKLARLAQLLDRAVVDILTEQQKQPKALGQ